MEKSYTAQAIEQRWYQIWEQQGYFQPKNQGEGYCIVIPPPNVTGTLHMGHGFQQTLMDALTRVHRMLGRNTLWLVGTDHAGIATQMVVERQLQIKGITRQELGREAFVEKVWEWKDRSDNAITQQIRRLGASVDWTRERFTMDPDLSEAVIEVFVRLYDEGLIYRGKRLVNWDPKFRTAISDLEVVSTEEAGHLWFIRYPLVDQATHIIIATTRPETMFGDVAIAVHPDDPRYQKLIGKEAIIPVCHRKIPIIADDSVDPEFGTGCVKITPAHDFNDYAMGQRHALPMINILTVDAHLNENVPEAYQGLERFDARKKLVAELQAQDLIEKIDDHKLNVPRGDRSGMVVEPYLTDQWFVKADVLAKPAIEAVKNGEIEFVPENWSKTYFQWLENIQDWCISRQLWWGHQIPAWYDAQGQYYVGRNQDEVRRKYQLANDIELTQDVDVLDTWFSSALWPFSTLGWPNETPDLKAFFPTDVLVTGFDIIFFWVARMIMMSLKFTGKIPFKQVYVTGLIRDHDGQKMSKSKGNVIDPIDLIDGITLEDLLRKRTQDLMRPEQAKAIEKATCKQFPQGIPSFGTDALRFTYCALATPGRDIRFDLGRIEGYRNFCNKLWNATRFVLMNCEEGVTYTAPENISHYSLADRYIVSRLQNTIADVQSHFAQYRFDLLAQSIYEFVWNEYCDWYLELSKPTLNNAAVSTEEKNATRYTLLNVLETTLRLIHPIMPFITEEIWQTVSRRIGKTGETIMLAPYPMPAIEELSDHLVELEVQSLKNIIINLRSLRSESSISPQQSIDVLLRKGTSIDRQLISDHEPLLKQLTKTNNFSWLSDTENPPLSAAALAGDLELFVPLAGLIDLDAELQRLDKNIVKLQKEQEQLRKQISSPNYVERAPQEVVTKVKARLLEIDEALIKLTKQQQQMESAN